MSAHKLANLMRQQAHMARGASIEPKTGIITDYKPFAVKVQLQPEGIETGWLPLLSPWVGNSWGMFCAPSVGDMVEVQFEQGSPEAAFACLRFYNDQDLPLNVPAKEFWLVHSTGSLLKLTNDGKLLLNGQVEIDATAPTINITATGNITAQAGGNVTVQASGNAMVQAGGSATIKAASIALQNAGAALKTLLNSAFAAWATSHVHSNGNGGGNTGAPTTAPGVGTQTSVLQAE